jgi:hypothetical protein
MSAFANVYVGSAPNDLTGDTLRNAFETINLNFANITAGNADITINAPVRSVAGRTGNVLLYVNDVTGAASLANVIAQTNAANTYANLLYYTTTSNITAAVYADVEANLASNIANIAESLITSGAVLDPVYANIDLINANVTAANSRISTLTTSTGVLNTQVGLLITANTVTDANLGTATTNILALQSGATASNVLISNNTNGLVAANARIATIDANLGTATTNITTLFANSATQATTLLELQGNAAAQSIALAVLTVNAAAQADTLNSLTANTIAQQITLASLQSNSAVQGSEIVQLTANSAVQGSQIRTLDANLGVATNNIVDIIANVTDLQTTAPTILALQANDATQGSQIRTLDATLGVTSTGVALNVTQINALRANITAANLAVITANADMKMYVDGVTTAWTANAIIQAVQIRTLDANLGTASTNITSLRANITAANVEIANLRSNVTAANAAVVVTNANVTAANVEIDALRANVTAANAAVVVTNANITAANVEINALRANITAANLLIAPISDLEAIVGNLVPITSNAYSIGNETVFWNELYTGGNIQTTSYVLASQGIQTPLTETGNLNSNTALIYAEAIVGNIRTVDSTGVANLGNIITSSGIFWANGTNYSSSFTTAGNLTFSDTTIGTAGGTGSGIILNSAGAGEIAMQDYVGINNTNPGYWLHIGDGSPGTGDNTGNVSIDFRNNTGTQRGSTILGYAWWDSASTGTDNRGTGVHTHFGIYKNDDTFDNKFIEFNYTSGNATVANLTATSLTVLTNVSYTMANYQNWTSNVSTVGGALDQLAERLKAAGF